MTTEGEDSGCLDRMEIDPKQEDTEYLDMGDMDIMEDMGEAMGTKTGETGGGRGGFQGNPQAVYTNPPQQDYNRTYNQMSYPIIQPIQPIQNNNQGAYQARAFDQNQIPGIPGVQGGHGVVTQPVYQLTVQQPGTAPQGEQGGQGGQRNQGTQGVQDKAKEFLQNLLAQYNN